MTLNKKRFRGDFAVLPLESSYEVVNRVRLEDYLRGVVPVEMGTRPREDSSALQAQAVAARTYALSRIGDPRRPFDLRSTTQDQVYGGANVEYDRASEAVDATRGLVILYQGRLADAPFHANCGGSTAEPNEVWRSTDAPYLNRVSDRIGNSNRFYCDIGPKYRWSRSLSGSDLNAALEQYLKVYSAVPGGRPGLARALNVKSRTASGRVAIMDVVTDRGSFPVRGDEIRYVLREPGGEILASTYFSVEPEVGRDGFVSRVTLRGQGNGHGVGMCQWGAIGRSRAGQSFRSILGTYYPGTSVGPLQ